MPQRFDRRQDVRRITQTAYRSSELPRQNTTSRTYNLGNGEGYSVTDVIKAVRRATNVTIAIRVGSGHAGDPAELVASSDLAEVKWDGNFNILHLKVSLRMLGNGKGTP